MTDEELAGESGAIATRSEGAPDAPAAEPVFTPKDFRLNLGARLAVVTEDEAPDVVANPALAEEPLTSVAARLGVTDIEPLPNLDSPAIRKLTWEHVVPDRPVSSAPSAATLVPLPPPRRVPPPPPQPVGAFQPPAPVVTPEPVVEHHEPEAVVVEEIQVEEIEVEAEVHQVEEVLEIEEVLEADEELEDVDVVEDVEEEPVVEEVVHQTPAVSQPEVNRLASVPDAFDEDDDEPIELPPITPSGPIVAHAQSVYAPVLAETIYIPPPARPATTTVAAIAAPANKGNKGKKGKHKSGRKPKRHLFRTFMTLVLLFGLLAGGAFAAKKYLLQEANWPAELKPLADDVAAARGLQFTSAVDVVPVPVADYAARLAGSAVGTRPETGPTWRALGLLNGELDLEAVGRQALNDSPAFYDPASKTIYLTDDLVSQPHLYRWALHRAMTVALLDQQYDWSGRVATASPATALAIRAAIDADALNVANNLSTNDGPELLAPELLAFVQGHGNTVSPSAYAAAVAGRVGAALRPTIATLSGDQAALAAFQQATPNNDDLFDAGRSPAIVASPPGTQGMMFWYYVLASRIDDTQAWSAATRWMGDSMVTSTGGASQCVDVKIAASNADGAAVLLGAFGAWAAVAPAESTTTVVPIDGNQVAIRACDPSTAVSAQLASRVPVVFGGAGSELSLVNAAVSAATPTGSSTVDTACLVNAARQRGAAFTSPADDAPVLGVNWQPPYVAANLDLAAGCVAAAPAAAAPVDPAAPAVPVPAP